ncbi:MAG: hemerythrin domain-containing protein [Myxococcota bacterium]
MVGTAEGRDVVEVLLEAHVELRHQLAHADALARASVTADARETAEGLSDYLECMLPLHCADEDRSLAPRLRGRHPVVDDALHQMERQHLALAAPLARLRLVCRMIARDVSRLHALRFELAAATDDVRACLTEHQALEESMIFPALKRVLYVDELESILSEMHQRRADAAA